MFNSTLFSTIESSMEGYGGGQLMFIFGTILTSMSGVITNFIWSINGYIYNMLFSSIDMDEDKDDSPEPAITEGLYKHILKNRTRFQGWNVRMAKTDFSSKKSEVEDHRFILPGGGVLFWNWSRGSWFPHLYYASYTREGKAWWHTNNMSLTFLRFSGWDAVRMLNSFSKDDKELTHYVWGYPGRDENMKWVPDRGRDRIVDKPVYIPTPDTEAVLSRVQLSIDSWKVENKSIKEFNAGRYLLYGPHGTYKTTLIRHIAHLYQMDIYTVTQDELAVKNLRKMVATLPERSILLFDDIDLSILEISKDMVGNQETVGRGGRDLKPVMKSVFGGTTKFPPGCLIFMTTNSEKLPKAVTSRFLQFYLGFAPVEWNRKIFLHICPGAEKQADAFMAAMGETKISQRKITESLAVSYTSSGLDPEKTLDQALKLLIPTPTPPEKVSLPKKVTAVTPPPEPCIVGDCLTGI